MKRAYLAFFAILGALTGISWLIVGVFVVGDLPGGWMTLAALWAVCFAPGVVLFSNVLRRAYPSSFLRCTVYRLFWYSQFTVVTQAPFVTLAFFIGLPFGAGPAFGRVELLVALPLYVVAAIWGYFGSRRLVVRRLEVRVKDLPAALDGLRIVQLSDLHVGPHTSPTHLTKVAELTREAKPHLIAYTGDQVDDYPRDMQVFASYFSDLQAPLGVFAIPGNHDVYAGWTEVRAGLDGMGARVLVNEAVPVTHNGAQFWLGGTGDPAGTQMARMGVASPAPDIARMLAPIPRGAFHVVLAHNPQLWPALASRGVPLTLSGHTHYGQIAIPALNWCLASVFLKHAMGWHREGDAQLYINPGTNYWGLPLRIGTPPEVTVLTLRRGAEPAISESPKPRG